MTEAQSTGADPSGVATRARVKGLGHIVLYVADLDRSAAFYRDVLEWTVAAAPPQAPVLVFRAGATHHDLLLIEVGPGAAPIPQGRRVGMYHFGVKVGDTDDELRAMLARVEAHPDLVTIVGRGDHGITHSLYVLDPDGNEVELYIDVPGIDWSDPTNLVQATRPLNL